MTAPTRVILIRHGQTAWNVEHRFQGQADPPLDATGRRQATATAMVLRALPMAAVLSSDLIRARQTAAAIAAWRGLPVRVLPELREVDLGAWTGLTRAEADGRFPEEYRDWRAHPATARRGGGETEDEAGARVAECVTAAAALWPGQTIAVVSHGLALRRAMRRIGIACPHLDNGGWVTIQLEARGTLPSAGVLTKAQSDRRSITVANEPETAILAGGCFWGMQDLIRKAPGVISTRVGYTGGDVANATYRNHRGHAEAIEIVFDPEQLSYRDLLEFFFQIHDPTTKNRQGNDIGDSYRSAIFYTTDEQKRIAEETIAEVDASGKWPGKVVTEVAAAGPFWEAEPEHQDYLERYPNGYTCHYVRPDWILGSKTRQT